MGNALPSGAHRHKLVKDHTCGSRRKSQAGSVRHKHVIEYNIESHFWSQDLWIDETRKLNGHTVRILGVRSIGKLRFLTGINSYLGKKSFIARNAALRMDKKVTRLARRMVPTIVTMTQGWFVAQTWYDASSTIVFLVNRREVEIMIIANLCNIVFYDEMDGYTKNVRIQLKELSEFPCSRGFPFFCDPSPPYF